jgi:hypothetical protein
MGDAKVNDAMMIHLMTEVLKDHVINPMVFLVDDSQIPEIPHITSHITYVKRTIEILVKLWESMSKAKEESKPHKGYIYFREYLASEVDHLDTGYDSMLIYSKCYDYFEKALSSEEWFFRHCADTILDKADKAIIKLKDSSGLPLHLKYELSLLPIIKSNNQRLNLL